MNEFWLITVAYAKDSIPHTFTIDEHPADWLAKYGHLAGADGLAQPGMTCNLIFALPISAEQFRAMQAAGYE